MEIFFVVISLTYEGGQGMKSGHFKGSSKFHCYWWISTLIEQSSFFGVRCLNVRSVSKIMEKVNNKRSWNLALHLIEGAEINVSRK